MRIWWERTTTGVLVRGRQGLDVGDRVGVQLVTRRRSAWLTCEGQTMLLGGEVRGHASITWTGDRLLKPNWTPANC